MEVTKLKIPRDWLARLPKEEQIFFLGAGHLLNVFAMLNKMLLLASHHEPDQKVEKDAKSSMSLLIGTLFAGKLYEGWVFVQSAYHNSRLSEEYEGPCALESREWKLPKTAREARKELKSFFGRDNILETVRNRTAFHNDAEQLACGTEFAIDNIDDADFVLYLNPDVGHSLYHLCEVAVHMGWMTGAGSCRPAERCDELIAAVTQVHRSFNEFLGEYMVAVATRFDLSSIAENVVLDVPKLDQVRIPFFIDMSDIVQDRSRLSVE